MRFPTARSRSRTSPAYTNAMPYPPLTGFAATMLVLFPAAARARVVAPDLLRHPPGLQRRRLRTPARGRAFRRDRHAAARLRTAVVARSPRQQVYATPGARRLRPHPHPEQRLDGILLDGAHHGPEHVERFDLILQKRIALPVRPQADALPQVVHVPQVLHPLEVDNLQQEMPLDLPHQGGAELPLSRLVRRDDVRLQPLQQR